MQGWPAIAHGIGIHAGQVVLDKACLMDELDGNGKPQGVLGCVSAGSGKRSHNTRADPLPASQSVACKGTDGCRETTNFDSNSLVKAGCSLLKPFHGGRFGRQEAPDALAFPPVPTSIGVRVRKVSPASRV